MGTYTSGAQQGKVHDRTAPLKTFRQRASSAKGKIDLSRTTTWSFHRSGWKYAIDSLGSLHHAEGVLLIDVLEEEFCWQLANNIDMGVVPVSRPWIGVMHNPPNIPAFAGLASAPETIVENFYFRASLPQCHGIYTLSKYLRDWLRRRIDVPVECLAHPTEKPGRQFSYDRFCGQARPKLVQVGAWLRNFRSLKLLCASQYQKICLNTGIRGDSYAGLEMYSHDRYNESGLEVVGEYRVVDWLSDEQYDELLTSCIVFLDLYDASGNNTIVECIRRHTPMLVKDLPAVREYLGDDYPLYFRDLDEAEKLLLQPEAIRSAHIHLQNLDDSRFSGEFFRRSVESSEIYRELPAIRGTTARVTSPKAEIDHIENLNLVAGAPLDTAYVFVVCTRNQEKKIWRCIQSILRQRNHDEFGVIIVDDLSEDNSFDIALGLLQQHRVPFVAVRNRQRRFYARNLYNSIHHLITNVDAVCVEVNGDDYLNDVDVIDVLAPAYSLGVLKTFGNYRYETDDAFSVDYAKRKPSVDASTLDISNPWNIDVYPSWMHLRTYARKLFVQVPVEYFLERDGQRWLIMCEDLSLHPKMAELAGNRVAYIDEVLYVYDVTDQDHDHRLNAWETYASKKIYRTPQGRFVGFGNRQLIERGEIPCVYRMAVDSRGRGLDELKQRKG